MATTIGKERIVAADKALRITSAAAFNGTAATKGTATDLLLTVVVTADGTSAFAGSVSYQLQGSNDGTTYTNVTPDKGSLNSDTAANAQSAHYGQLQFKQYRVVATGATSPLLSVSTVYNFQPVADSFDATVA